MREIERFMASKSGSPDGGEDAIEFTEAFACVVDGATSQSGLYWDGKSGGRIAAETICVAVRQLAFNCTASEAIAQLTHSLQRLYHQHGLHEHLRDHPLDRPTASVVLFSRHRNEIWFVGDCQSLEIGSDGAVEETSNRKLVDDVNAATRALYLSSEIAAGRTVEQLRENDVGRQYIKTLLERQRSFQNAQPESPYCYWTIDGLAVDPAGIRVKVVAGDSSEIVLASDGYPKLLLTLAETENHLRQVISKDPLLIKPPYQSTKGVAIGNDSFDDRAYLRIAIR